MDELTRRILEADKDRQAHPEDYAYTLVCSECQGRNTFGCPKAEVVKYRERAGVGPGTPVVLPVICDRCARLDEEGE